MTNGSPKHLLTRLENKINRKRPDVEVIINDELKPFDPEDQKWSGTATLYISNDDFDEDDPELEETVLEATGKIVQDKVFHTRTVEFIEEMYYLGRDPSDRHTVEVTFILDMKGRFWRNR